MEIDKAIRIFSKFLNNCWDIINPLVLGRFYTSNESSISDWLQANWEILVEKKILQLNEYLEFYGDGADYYGDSCRIANIKAVAIFSVQTVLNDKNKTDLQYN